MVDGVREVQVEVQGQPDATRAEPARSICEAVQRLVASAENDARDANDRAEAARRRS